MTEILALVALAAFLVTCTAVLKTCRNVSAMFGQSLTHLKELANKEKVDLQALLNPPPPPCHHVWGVLKEERLTGAGETKLVCILHCENCGALDKTVESVKNPVPRSECMHAWQTQKTKELESAFEQVQEARTNCKEMAEDPQPWMFRKSYVITRICARCGELNTVVASNFDMADAEA